MASGSVERSVARAVRAVRPVAVIANQGTGGQPFRAARDVGTIAILNANFDVWGANAAIRAELANEISPIARAELQSELDDVGERHGLRDVRLAGHSIVESERMRDRLVSLGANPDAITNLYNGVDTARWQPTSRDYQTRPLRAVVVARVGRAKGIHHASEAAALSGVVERFTAVGGGVPATFRSRYPATHFTGLLRAEGVAEALARADVFVLPTLADNMARAVLEAMAAGLPVIVTPESGYEGVITDGVEGFIVPSRDPAAIAGRLQQLSANGELRRRMGLAARALAERYSWEAYEQRFREALDGPLAFLRPAPGPE
jgi:glycosyltransferase involved in cell wall biosynthesis